MNVRVAFDRTALLMGLHTILLSKQGVRVRITPGARVLIATEH